MTVTAEFSADPAVPPTGHRLQLGHVCADLKVSVADLASVTGLPKTTAFKLLTNEWPARLNDTERAEMRTLIEQHLRERGATAEQLATLWHAHLGKGPRAVALRQAAAQQRSTAGRGGKPALAEAPDLSKPEPEPEDPDMLLPKQTLSPQARRHFKLFTNPFDGKVLSDAAMFDSSDIRWVRESAWQTCQLASFVAVVGESGAGKTTIVEDLEERIARDGRPVIVIRPGVLGMEPGQSLKSTDILHAVITTLQPDATVPQTEQARTAKAKKLLLTSAAAGASHLLLVEEAHDLSDSALKHLKRLHELQRGRTSLLGILLVGQPELKLRLANGLRTGALREVAQRCEVVELLPLDDALGDYLRCRAQAAGVQLDVLMEPKAIDALRARLTRRVQGGAVSMCYPLAVNNMMTRALNAAAACGAPVVTADLVAAC